MAKKSAGILAFRRQHGVLQVFLAHPGGPFYAHKDKGTWTIPKGEYNEAEDLLTAAKREFAEEIGLEIEGDFIELKPVQQNKGKTVYAWAVAPTADIAFVASNTFPLEWPPRSGKMQQVPEVDKAEWFTITEAKEKILPGQMPLLEQLEHIA